MDRLVIKEGDWDYLRTIVITALCTVHPNKHKCIHNNTDFQRPSLIFLSLVHFYMYTSPYIDKNKL